MNETTWMLRNVLIIDIVEKHKILSILQFIMNLCYFTRIEPDDG
jgi:hypothetical protein